MQWIHTVLLMRAWLVLLVPAGGAAHSFKVGGYTFDAGPSFHMGLADPPGTSRNPLAQVLELLEERVECKRYDQVRPQAHAASCGQWHPACITWHRL